MQIVVALVAGLIFGFGMIVSQMINPSKVVGFLDLFGDWDPSLMFVMGGGLIVTGIGYRLVWKKEKPQFGDVFQVPTSKDLDARLIAGAALFGIGWGLGGLCPGPALTSLTIGGENILIFLASMFAGFALFKVTLARG